MITVTRSVDVPRPLAAVLDALGDPVEALWRNRHLLYSAPTAEEPGPQLRSAYSVVERFGPIRMALRLHVEQIIPGRGVVLRGRNRWLEQVDAIVLRELTATTSRITRHVQLRLRGPALLARGWASRRLEGFVDDAVRDLAAALQHEIPAPVVGGPPRRALRR